jgi:hypothetical protein
MSDTLYPPASREISEKRRALAPGAEKSLPGVQPAGVRRRSAARKALSAFRCGIVASADLAFSVEHLFAGKFLFGFNWDIQAKGLTIRNSPKARPFCKSSLIRVSQPASRAAATIRAS